MDVKIIKVQTTIFPVCKFTRHGVLNGPKRVVSLQLLSFEIKFVIYFQKLNATRNGEWYCAAFKTLALYCMLLIIHSHQFFFPSIFFAEFCMLVYNH